MEIWLIMLELLHISSSGLFVCATPVKVRLVSGYATAISILKATPLQFPSQNGTGYYLAEDKLNDPFPGR